MSSVGTTGVVVEVKSDFYNLSANEYKHTYRITTDGNLRLGLRFHWNTAWGVYSPCCNAGLTVGDPNWARRGTIYCTKCYELSAYGNAHKPVAGDLNRDSTVAWLTPLVEHHHNPLIAPIVAWDLVGLGVQLYRAYDQRIRHRRRYDHETRQYFYPHTEFKIIAEEFCGLLMPRPENTLPPY